MNFREAVKNYGVQETKENLTKQVTGLLEEMTLDEKIYMLSGHGALQSLIDIIKTKRNYNVRALPAGGCKRLGIPTVLFTDGPRGVVMGNSTCLPVSMLRASTFDEELEYRIGKMIADEAIAQGANYFAGICINLVRNPRWGRCQESYGEDPCLLGKMGVALTKSVQEEGMIACPKHYALNSIEDLRFYIDVKTDERTLREVYLPHFKKCIDAGALSIMGAYNRYNEFYCCENKKLLTDILRDEWGFDGFVMSDFIWGVHDTEQALRAGLDIEMMITMQYSPKKIKKCLKTGKLNEDHINRAVKNILGVLIRQIPKIKPRSMSVVHSEENRKIALEVAEKGMVLLQNRDGVLPLEKNAKILVAGSYADTVNVGDHGSSRVHSKNVITPYKGLEKQFKDVLLSNGNDLNKAKDAAQNAETVILCVGNDSEKEGEYFANTKYKMTEKPKNCGGDRASLRLTDKEISLIKEMKDMGKKVIVVLYSGCAIIVEEWKEYADAIIMNYYSGIEGGTALTNLLLGKANFSGKLPFTVAKTEEDYPQIIGIGEKPYVIEYGYYHGYTLFDKERIEPAYPFGYGLSYTTFEVGNFDVDIQQDTIVVKTSVKNTGDSNGADVVQVFVGSNEKDLERPVKLLKGFKRVELLRGEEKNIEISIDIEDLKFYSETGWNLDSSYILYVGDDSEKAMENSKEIDLSLR